MSILDTLKRRPVAGGMAAALALATVMTVAPVNTASADRWNNNDRAAAAAATGFAAGAIVGATASQGNNTVVVRPGYAAPRPGYRANYRDCRTKTVKVVDRATGRTVVRKTTNC